MANVYFETILGHLQALPSRDAERALLEFRDSPNAWDICVGVIAGAHSVVPEVLSLFAAQTLHFLARRFRLAIGSDVAAGAVYAQTLVAGQLSLLAALKQTANTRGHREEVLLCAALGALSVRNLSSLREALSAALQQLPQGLAVQLLLSVAEEGEALLSRLGGDVEAHGALHHVLREEVGHHVIAWLAGVGLAPAWGGAEGGGQPGPQQQQRNSEPHTQCPQHSRPRPESSPSSSAGTAGGSGAKHHPGGELDARPGLLMVRCFAAWVRLGCLYGSNCPAGAVQALVGNLLKLVHSSGPYTGGVCGGDGGDTERRRQQRQQSSLRHEACEALSDVIEYGLDVLVRALHGAVTELAQAAAAACANAAAATTPRVTTTAAAFPSGDGRMPPAPSGSRTANAAALAADAATADAAYDIAQLLSSYAAARQGELVPVCCRPGLDPDPSPHPTSGVTAGMAAASGAEAACLLAALAQLGSLPAVTSGGCPVGWPALQALADWAVGCVAAVEEDGGREEEAGRASGGVGREVGGGAGGSGDVEMAVDGGAGGGGDASQPPVEPDAAAPPHDHCMSALALQPRTGLPVPLIHLYDNVLRAVLSCCVTWGVSSDTEDGSAIRGGGGHSNDEDDEEDGAGGLLRLPPECGEALRCCLQACAGVVGQARQVATAELLLQETGVLPSSAATQPPAASAEGLQSSLTVAAAGSAAAGPPARTAAVLTAALAAVAACGRLPDDTTGASRGGTSADGADGSGGLATAAGSSAATVVLTAAGFLRCQAATTPAATTPAAAATAAAGRSGLLPRSLLVPLWLHYCGALEGSCRAVLCHVGRRAGGAVAASGAGYGQRGGHPAGAAGAAAVAALCEMAEAALAGLQSGVSAAAAARALLSLTAAAEALHLLPLPAVLAERLVDAVHSLPYDAGPRYQAAVPELARAAVAAVRLAGLGPAAGAGLDRLALLHRLLTPSLACIAQVTAAVHPASTGAATPPWSRLPREADAALSRHLRLFEIVVLASSNPAGAPGAAACVALTAPQLDCGGPAMEEAALVVSQVRASQEAEGTEDMAVAAWAHAVFVQQAWPHLHSLLLRGAAGRFLLPLCRCLTVLLRARVSAAAAVASEQETVGFRGQDAATTDPWVTQVLAALIVCVGRPGAKHVHEPLIALLEACCRGEEDDGAGGSACGSSSAGGSSCRQGQLPAQKQRQQLWRRRHAALAAATVHGVLCANPVAVSLATQWRSADGDPESAECLLRLATAAARHVLPYSIDGTWVASIDKGALATAALRLAAASSGCDHRQVAAAALACTCAVLDAACGHVVTAAAVPLEAVVVGSRPGVPQGDPWVSVAPVAAEAVVSRDLLGPSRRELVGVVMQLGHVVAAGLLAALLSSSPLPRLQRVAAALVQLGTGVALGCLDQQLLLLLPGGTTAGQLPVTAMPLPDPAAGKEACGRLLASWLVAAAAHLQLPEGAALTGAWVPVLVEAGACAAAAAGRAAGVWPQAPPEGGGGGSGDGGSGPVALRLQQRRLRRLLREFAESKLR